MRLSRLSLLGLSVFVLAACSASAPRAPLGFDKHPANSPDTVASLARPLADPKAKASAPSETPTQTQTNAVRPDAVLAHVGVIVLSDQTAPQGFQSLTPAYRAALVAAARSALSVRILCRSDHERPSGLVRLRLARRGAAVRQFLIAQGVEPAKIRIFVRSAGAFVADNATQAGRAQNRRVEIQFA